MARTFRGAAAMTHLEDNRDSVTQTDKLRLAVFIDFDNIEIGVKNSLNTSFDAGLVLEALKERGEVVSKMAYSDWQRAGGYSRALTQHAIRMVQRNMTPGGDKNGADINLALDALEMAFTHPHINAFVIVGGDSDFISLVEKLKQYDKKVFIVGGRQFTSVIMQKNCHEFIAYENLASVGGATTTGGRRAQGQPPKGERAGIEQAIPLVRRAMKVLSERDVEPQLGLFKSTLLQLDSTFSERTYGAGTFRDFAQRLEKAGVLTVEHTKSGWIVGPANGGAAPESAPEVVEPAEAPAAAPAASGAVPVEESRDASDTTPAKLGNAADGVRELASILASAEIRKWPLYLRHVKQVIRQTRPGFDERAYGFGSLADLLRAAHRENVVRVERDRQGVIRVFQATGTTATTRPAARPAVRTSADIYDVENDPNLAEDLARAHGLVPVRTDEADEPATQVDRAAESDVEAPATGDAPEAEETREAEPAARKPAARRRRSTAAGSGVATRAPRARKSAKGPGSRS